MSDYHRYRQSRTTVSDPTSQLPPAIRRAYTGDGSATRGVNSKSASHGCSPYLYAVAQCPAGKAIIGSKTAKAAVRSWFQNGEDPLLLESATVISA